MRPLVILLSVMTFTGCGQQSEDFVTTSKFKIDITQVQHNPEFNDHVSTFIEASGIIPRARIRVLQDNEYMNDSTLGVCFYNENLIVINKGLNKDFTNWTIFHELLHCAAGLGHSDNPNSLLHYVITAQSINAINNNSLEAIRHAINEFR